MKAIGMIRTRWVAVGIAATLVAAGGAAWRIGDGRGRQTREAAVAEETTSTTAAPTTTTVAPTTTTTAAATALVAAPPDDVLERGERGEEVAALQRRLAELHLDPGPADGVFGVGTMYAVQAFQKLHGMGPDGRVGPEVRAALAAPTAPQPLIPNGGADRVEVDLRSQLLFLYKDGQLRLISHVSTGNNERYCVKGRCGRAVTPVGAFRFMWRWNGWRQSRLGKLYNPVYFTRSGVAIHGSLSVPTHPASHGCIRIPMHIAEYFPSLVRSGDPVYVLDGVKTVGPAPEPEPSGPPPDDPPTTPEDTTTTTSPPSDPPSDGEPPQEPEPDDDSPPTTPSTTVPE